MILPFIAFVVSMHLSIFAFQIIIENNIGRKIFLLTAKIL